MADMTPEKVLQELLRTRRITGSWLAATAAGVSLQEGTIPTLEGDACPACGHLFLPGERGHDNPTHQSPTFNDAYSMAGDARAPVCSACAAVFKASFLTFHPCGVACADGFFPFAKNVDRMWFLLNPPEPPFVMAAGLAKNQHIFWRTPVALSREVFPVRVGTHVGTIRRQVVKQAAELCSETLEAAERFAAEQADEAKSKRGRPRKEGAQTIRHPFARLDRDLMTMTHGSLKADVMRFLASGKAPREMNILGELNQIELWALANIANTKPKDALTERPAPFQASTKAKAGLAEVES